MSENIKLEFYLSQERKSGFGITLDISKDTKIKEIKKFINDNFHTTNKMRLLYKFFLYTSRDYFKKHVFIRELLHTISNDIKIAAVYNNEESFLYDFITMDTTLFKEESIYNKEVTRINMKVKLTR